LDLNVALSTASRTTGCYVRIYPRALENDSD